MTRRKGITASELVAQLNANPEWLERRRQQQEKSDAIERAARVAEGPLVQALNEAGLGWLRSVWDLVNTDEPYSHVLPILIEHLQRDYPAAILEGIARAMAVPESRRFWNILLRLYWQRPDVSGPHNVKWAIGCALAASATDDVIDDVIALVREPRHGEDRAVFLRVLSASPLPRAQAAFEDAARDPQLMKEARFIKRVSERQRRKADRARRKG